jgi:hypothetical protein
MYNASAALAAGRIHDRILELLIGVVALMIEKPQGGHRPLGYGPCFRRATFGDLPLHCRAEAAQVGQ